MQVSEDKNLDNKIWWVQYRDGWFRFGADIETFMKQVFSSPDSAQIGLAQSMLDAAGIACEVRNDAISQVLPGMPFVTELWVLRDDDCEEARRLIRREREEPPTA